MRHSFVLLTLLLFFSFAPSFSFASSWVKEQGEFFLSPTFNYYRAKDYYDKEGNKKPIGCTFEKRELQVYGEYGLTKNTTLTFKLPYDWLKCGSKETSGFTDIEIGAIRQVLRDKNYAVAVYGNVIVPTGYSINDDPRLGYSRLGLEGGLLAGKSGKFGFLDAGVGYRYYFGYPSSQIRGYVTVGMDISKNLQVLTSIDLQMGLGDGKKKTLGQNIFLEPDYKLIQLYIGPRIRLGNISLVIKYQHVLWGRNTGVGRGFNIGLWWSF